MTDRISVTEVRNALRCPRLFALGRSLGKSVGFPVGSSCLGATFHRIVERLSREAAAAPKDFAALPRGAARDDVEAELGSWLLELLINEVSYDSTYASMPGEVDDLAEALRELARHLSGRLTKFDVSPAAALQQLFHAGERAVEGVLSPDGPLIHGRLDALYADPAGNLDVIEYKLTDEANDQLDRAQVALYRELLRVTENVEGRPVVLRFLPMLREVSMTVEASNAFLQSTVLPLIAAMPSWSRDPVRAPATERRDLCAACPMARPCAERYPTHLPARDDPPTAAARPRPASAEGALDSARPPPAAYSLSDEEGRQEADLLKDRILAELRRQGAVAVCPHSPIVGPTLYIIETSKPRGPVSQLDRAAEDVRHHLAAEDGIDVEYEKTGGHRRFIVRRPKPRRVVLGPLLEARREWLSARPGRFIVGQCPDGEVLCADFGDSSTPHVLVAGQAGSGKSVLLQSIVASLVQYHGPSAIRFTLVDPKRVTFNTAGFLAAVSAHLDGPVRYDVEDTLPAIEQLVEAMEERYALFERAKVVDIGEFNEQSPAELIERRVLIIDEFQDLVTDKASAQAFFAGVKRLGAKARAAGIHLVLATQRPDRDVVPPVVKANLGGKIALQVASKINSRIVLDEGGAERLLGKGDLLANLGRGTVRAQAPLLA
jgi:DNA segregation ATPase FtsK/SpoIIIE, S-DNA-T family